MGPAGEVDGAPRRAPSRRVVALLEGLAGLGARPDDSRDERLRLGTLILASVLIALLSFVWVVTYLAFGDVRSAAIPAVYQAGTVVGLLVLARTRRPALFRTWQLAVMLVLPALLQASRGGFVASSGIILWGLFVPLAALALLGHRRALPWLGAFLAVLVALALLDPFLAGDRVVLPEGVVVSFFVLNILGVTVSAYVMLAYFVEQRARAHRALETERLRSERLLLNVLPQPIAERLKSADGVIADRHETVTVLFADLVDFTRHASVLAPEDLVALLDRIFSAFDRVADEHEVEKIKTVGDAYMLAGGLSQPHRDHVQAVARAALSIREELGDIAAQTGQRWLAVRIGIDTGPVVAGVIGRRRSIYDLWGDTVNTASRMESQGLAGQIQVTRRVAVALEHSFAVRPRGTLEVRGKGPMQTFLLDGELRRPGSRPGSR